MCGIIGTNLKLKNKEELQFCKKLMEESSIRGLHSFGMCSYSNNKYNIIKSLKKSKIQEFIFDFSLKGTKKFIFHNRYSTSGDWKNMENNQPILVEDFGSIAFNGVLTMKTKEEFEDYYQVQCNSYNDAEIFLRLMEKGQKIEDILTNNPTCSFAGIFLIKDELFGIRNEKRPLYYYESNNGKYLVSTLDIIKRSGGKIENANILKPFERCYI